jgi:glycerol-1-phosphatase
VTALGEGSADPLSERYDTALLDLDGVVYVGPHPVAGAPETLDAIRANGMQVAFVTNNAARTPAVVAQHLNELGVSARPDDVVTSAQAAARLVADRFPRGAPVLVVGGEGLEVALHEAGLRPVWSADDEPVAVVQGFSPDIGWRQLAEGAYAVSRGALWVASNLDRTVPTPRGLAPGNGSLVGVIRTATGAEPLAAGKPELPLHQEAVRRTGSRRPLVVGDRLDTDVEGANRAGVDSLLVLTGVTSAAELIGADAVHRPSYIAEGLADGLLRSHPAVDRGDGQWSCAGWTVRADAGRWRLDGDGPRIDALRAACVATWDGAEPEDLTGSLSRLGW